MAQRSRELDIASGLESKVSLPWELIGKNVQAFEEKIKKCAIGARQGKNTFLPPARVKPDQNLL